jgi:translation initiation factor 2 alpha subunit (eIF-2alpha)
MENLDSQEQKEQKLSRRQEAALVALLQKGSIKEAAESSNLSEVTLWRYLRDKAFVERYREARMKLVDAAIAKLQSAADAAVNTLREIAEDKNAAPTARIAAARTILSQAVEGVVMMEKGIGNSEDEHSHLCQQCLQQFSCIGSDCADFEFQVCKGCKNNPMHAKLPHERLEGVDA